MGRRLGGRSAAVLSDAAPALKGVRIVSPLSGQALTGRPLHAAVTRGGRPIPNAEYRWKVDGALVDGEEGITFTPTVASSVVAEARAMTTSAGATTAWVASPPVAVIAAPLLLEWTQPLSGLTPPAAGQSLAVSLTARVSGTAPLTYLLSSASTGVSLAGSTLTLDATALSAGASLAGTVTVSDGFGQSAASAFALTVGAASAALRIIPFGQSLIEGMRSRTDGIGATDPATSFWDKSAPTFGEVPGTGFRAFANRLHAITGLDVRIAEAATGGQMSFFFTPGFQGWDDFEDAFAALGGVDAVLCRQGEGDASDAAPGFKQTYKDNWLEIADAIEALAGRPVPMIWASLATVDGTAAGIVDSEWDQIQAAIRELCEEDARFSLAGSAIDSVRTDLYHPNGVSHARVGERMAVEVGRRLGFGAVSPAWYITDVTRASTTTTTVTVTHGRGTDFTPTTGITGFEVSEDGSTWVAATGARATATSITLTHTALGADADRFVRYQYGTEPDITGLVLDNSDLAAPLQLSAGTTLADLALPVMTSATTFSIPEGTTQTVVTLTASRPSSFAIGGTDAALFEVVGGVLRFVAMPDVGSDTTYSITITPTASDNGDVGAAQSLSVTVTDVDLSTLTPATIQFRDSFFDVYRSGESTFPLGPSGTDTNKGTLAFRVTFKTPMLAAGLFSGGLISARWVLFSTTRALRLEFNAALSTSTYDIMLEPDEAVSVMIAYDGDAGLTGGKSLSIWVSRDGGAFTEVRSSTATFATATVPLMRFGALNSLATGAAFDIAEWLWAHIAAVDPAVHLNTFFDEFGTPRDLGADGTAGSALPAPRLYMDRGDWAATTNSGTQGTPTSERTAVNVVLP